MRPLAALLSILAGSAFALFAGLTRTWSTLLFVPKEEAGERFGDFCARVLWTKSGEGELASRQ